MRRVLVVLSLVAPAACIEPLHPTPGAPATAAPEAPDADVDDPAAAGPPALAGGTLLLSRDGNTAFASDPDRDLVWMVDLARGAILATTALEPGDEPGRIAEDATGHIHVVLRRAGEIASIDPAFAQDVRRRRVCSEPRGIAHDDARGVLHVACTGGELVTLPAGAGPEIRRLQLDRDLRDVVVDGDRLLVTRLRSAEMLVVSVGGDVVDRKVPPNITTSEDPEGYDYYYGAGIPSSESSVAWRAVPLPSGGIAMAHQRAQTDPVSVEPGGYGEGEGREGQCSPGIVSTSVSVLTADGELAQSPILTGVVLPVDVAVSHDGERYAVLSAAKHQVVIGRVGDLSRGVPCMGPGEGEVQAWNIDGQPVAVVFDRTGRVVVQTRDRAGLSILDENRGSFVEVASFEYLSRGNTGFDTFHHTPLPPEMGGTALACASCHPEGRDDGRVWTFDGLGPRRTQSLPGGVLATTPFHWDGALPTLHALMTEVFVGRMAAPPPTPDAVDSLGRWLDGLPAPVPPDSADPAAAERGRGIFESAGTACAACHSGERFTSNVSVDVGTGGILQVPSLVGVWDRAPFLHDGCAETLRDRFEWPCGDGDHHGVTSHLDVYEVGDLVAYLDTL